MPVSQQANADRDKMTKNNFACWAAIRNNFPDGIFVSGNTQDNYSRSDLENCL
jgi:hypothetical protein